MLPPSPATGSLTSRVPSHRDRVLTLVEDLADERDAIDLDTIDGECYWRGCRADLLHALAALCDAPPPPISRRPDELDVLIEPADNFAFIRHGLRIGEAFAQLEASASRLYPRVVWRRLLDGERIAMRAAEAELIAAHSRTSTEAGPSLQIKVFSGNWTGRDVEREIRRQIPKPAGVWPYLHQSADEEYTIAIGLRFRFVAASRPQQNSITTERADAHILVDVPLPLPPILTIAREYDAIVRESERWHERLPGVRSGQEALVALRTWAVGLLMADGMLFGDAMTQTCRRLCVSHAE